MWAAVARLTNGVSGSWLVVVYIWVPAERPAFVTMADEPGVPRRTTERIFTPPLPTGLEGRLARGAVDTAITSNALKATSVATEAATTVTGALRGGMPDLR